MSRSRVFILYSHSLFARGVQSLLSKDDQVEVIGMEKDDDPRVLETIKSLSPDVILVDSGANRDEACLTISEIFREIPGARVISLNVQESGIDIYDKQRIVACGPDDLVWAIRRGEPQGNGATGRQGDAEMRKAPAPFELG